jgi:hypothetical protein
MQAYYYFVDKKESIRSWKKKMANKRVEESSEADRFRFPACAILSLYIRKH